MNIYNDLSKKIRDREESIKEQISDADFLKKVADEMTRLNEINDDLTRQLENSIPIERLVEYRYENKNDVDIQMIVGEILSWNE